MPRYFFDVRDGDEMHRDEVGLDLPSMDDAVEEARRAIGEMARESFSKANTRLEIVIRDGDEGPIRLTITMSEVDLQGDRSDQAKS